MAESLDDPEFYLPTHFLTDDVVLHNAMEIGAGFPTEFPYEFDSCPFNSALSSPVESEGGSSDEDDFLAGLTRRLAQSSIQQIISHTSQAQKLSVPTFPNEKPEWVMSGSPQSTLSGIGSWSSNGSPTAPSPPTTPYGAQNDTWDLIYAAAGQVARLKMTNSGAGGSEGPTKFTSHNPGLLGPPRRPSPPHPPCLKIPPAGICHNQNFTQFHHVNKPQCSSRAWGNQTQVKLPWSGAHQQQQHIQNRGGNNIVGYENSPCVNLPQSAWPPLQAQHQQRNSCTAGRPILSNGGAHVKRESAGTGVFLPRRYSPASEPPRRRQGCQTVLLPAKVVQALNLNFEDLNGQPPRRFTTGLTPDQETLLARRNALLTQQRRNALRPEGPLNCEVRLPQEWTY